jgi:hypothetical protein
MLNEHPPIQLDAMLQVFSDAHDTGIVNAEIDPETEVSKGHLKDVGAMLTSKYHQVATGAGQDDKTGLQLPKVNPVAVEKTYLVNVTPAESDPIPFMAIIDLEEELTVADLKCKKTAVSQQDIDNSLQLSLYAYIFQSHGYIVMDLAIDHYNKEIKVPYLEKEVKMMIQEYEMSLLD